MIKYARRVKCTGEIVLISFAHVYVALRAFYFPRQIYFLENSGIFGNFSQEILGIFASLKFSGQIFALRGF